MTLKLHKFIDIPKAYLHSENEVTRSSYSYVIATKIALKVNSQD